MTEDHPSITDNLMQRAVCGPPFSKYPMSWVPWHLPRPLVARTGQKEVMAELPAECLWPSPSFIYQGESTALLLFPKTRLPLYLSAYFVAIATGPRQSLPQDGNG